MNLFEKYTKTSGPFRNWSYSHGAVYKLPCHYINNNGTFARDERAIGYAIFTELKIEYMGQGRFLLTQTDGYRSKIQKIGDLNQVLYAAQEIIDHWNDEIVIDYKNGWLVTNKKEN